MGADSGVCGAVVCDKGENPELRFNSSNAARHALTDRPASSVRMSLLRYFSRWFECTWWQGHIVPSGLVGAQLHYKIKHCRRRRGNAFDDLGQHVILGIVSRSKAYHRQALAGRTFSSLVKTGSREPAITGEKRKKGAFKLREKHPSKSSRTRIYRTLMMIGRVDSSIRQTIKWLARLCNKGKFGRAAVGEA